MKKLPLFLILCCFATCLQAQSISASVVNNMGGTMQGGNIKLTYSVGELAITTSTTGGFSLAQGFLQPEIQNEITAIEEDYSQYSFSCYPNPIKDKMQIQTDIPDISGFRLYDSRGVGTAVANYAGKELDFTNFQAGIYFLQVLNSKERVVRTIKLIKAE